MAESKVIEHHRQCPSCNGMRVADTNRDVIRLNIRMPEVKCVDCGETGAICEFPMRQLVVRK